jgi:hypothetical protein
MRRFLSLGTPTPRLYADFADSAFRLSGFSHFRLHLEHKHLVAERPTRVRTPAKLINLGSIFRPPMQPRCVTW